MQFRATFIFAIATSPSSLLLLLFHRSTMLRPLRLVRQRQLRTAHLWFLKEDAFGGASDFKTLSYASFGWLFPDWT
ncbi:hypothetical protein AGABI1DRAFT_115526 [Agaricus bisporus var. burnettii JB137-S8]|uniref:Uncharacterized protein n=1 Tax=Agaricus bisporus var. burnettii (strain JB137-S8 / ATCC MYA-4627 / FGSC 10392) TaxID=597362 RepID=K5WND6_AGABU|nr:uncharacterized protein AGABI1DRAFT_115526 [Agaricus bisporus var. burnettii JB137-S8]EKM76851.1 hypothetical protein AGABI1DRAFT_115526 [Agaricus bisporus var. burnettii JB137-S8]